MFYNEDLEINNDVDNRTNVILSFMNKRCSKAIKPQTH